MAGFGPAIPEPAVDPSGELLLKMAAGRIYFMTNRPNGILYVGGTDNTPRRAWEHCEGLVEGFTNATG
jgi:putative endonuclease